MLTISLLVAVAAFVGPLLAVPYWSNWSPTEYYVFVALFALALPACWLGLMSVAFSRYRVRGLWFLTGAPFAMCWLAIYTWLLWSCRHGCA